MKFLKKFGVYSIIFVFFVSLLKVMFNFYSAFFGESELLYSKADFTKILANNSQIKHCQMEVTMPNSTQKHRPITFLLKSQHHQDCEELFFKAVSTIFVHYESRKDFIILSKTEKSFKIKTIFVQIEQSPENIKDSKIHKNSEIKITIKNLDEKPV
jgi:hypothetical protein